LRVWWLCCVVGFGCVMALTKVSLAQEAAKKNAAALPEGENATEVAQKIAQELAGNFGDKDGRDAAIATFEKQVAEFNKKYADEPVRWQLKMMQTQVLKATGEKAGGGGKTSEQLLTEIAAAKDAPEGLIRLAKSSLESIKIRKELTSKPFQESFKALDGSDVDFAKLRGKVVLVDFWATWCPPCMAEVPKLVETYKKLHGKGFEIVGISLDSDEDELKKVLADKEMTWPQYFERKEENQLAKKYGISAIPEMWLINKKGMVKIYSRDQDLAEEVEKLLAE
jgi:thiol-disulfide isomerase/thioredoxin